MHGAKCGSGPISVPNDWVREAVSELRFLLSHMLSMYRHGMGLWNRAWIHPFFLIVLMDGDPVWWASFVAHAVFGQVEVKCLHGIP